jgi:hypothetical protein
MLNTDIVRARPARPRRKLLAPLALFVAWLLFGPFYFLRALGLVWNALGITISSPPVPLAYAQALFILDYYPNVLFSDLGRYLAASVLSLGLAAGAAVLDRPGRVGALLLALTLLGVATFPWLYRYQPALFAAPGHELVVVTRTGLLDGMVKRAQLGAELVPCRYTLLGWGEAGDLYYQSDCGADSRLWTLAPDREAAPRAVAEAPAGLVAKESQSAVVGVVRYPSSDPSTEANLRLAAIRGKVGLPSPDGRRVALVSRHIYGPEDVLLVSR